VTLAATAFLESRLNSSMPGGVSPPMWQIPCCVADNSNGEGAALQTAAATACEMAWALWMLSGCVCAIASAVWLRQGTAPWVRQKSLSPDTTSTV
jgi:hypothetical protein